MELQGGLAGKTLRIDLTHEDITIEDSRRYIEFLGGRGVGSRILFDELDVDVRPYDPENLLIFSPGLFVGAGVPQATRTNISSKNPITGGIAYSNVGGGLGSHIKRAGFDNIIIYGRAKMPLYLSIIDGDVELRDASDLWGLGIYEVERRLREEVDQAISTASIGPAGENLIFASAIIVDTGHAAGGCALASVMGSKRLKAIAALGTGEVEVADPEALEELSKEIRDRLRRTEHARLQMTVGSYGRVIPNFQRRGILPVRNYQDDQWVDEKLERLLNIKPYRVEMIPCDPSCCEPCINRLEIREGRYAGTLCVGLHANSGYGFGPRFDIDDPEVIIKATAICNDLGIDIDNASTILSWAFELYERGIITEEQTGIPLRWGDGEALLRMLEDLAYRRGFGAVLAEGFKSAANRIGNGAEYYAMEVKGQGIIDGVRTSIAWGFGHMVSTRGARHLDGSPTTEARDISPEEANRLFGVPTAAYQTAYEGKAKLVFWFENYKALTDALGICYFSTYWGSTEKLGPEDYAKLFKAVTGVELSAEELMRIGWRIHEVEKAFNTLHVRFTRRDDLPPMRVFIEPVKTGAWRGFKLSWERYNEMLTEYYRLHGWDPETGWQRREQLEKLGLGYVAEKLRRHGCLLD